ncbi:MAG: VOC family protein [Fimbriimonas sp.]|nr:VOC family protein [Fimbriimonas sp.]
MKSVTCVALGCLFGLGLASYLPTRLSVIDAKLVNVVLTTSRIEAEAKFYESNLGFKRFFSNATSCFLNGHGVNLVFVKAKSRASETRNACLDVSVSDLEAAAKALAEAGIRFDRSDPSILTLHDPDGTLVEIVHG